MDDGAIMQGSCPNQRIAIIFEGVWTPNGQVWAISHGTAPYNGSGYGLRFCHCVIDTDLTGRARPTLSRSDCSPDSI